MFEIHLPSPASSPTLVLGLSIVRNFIVSMNNLLMLLWVSAPSRSKGSSQRHKRGKSRSFATYLIGL